MLRLPLLCICYVDDLTYERIENMSRNPRANGFQSKTSKSCIGLPLNCC